LRITARKHQPRSKGKPVDSGFANAFPAKDRPETQGKSFRGGTMLTSGLFHRRNVIAAALLGGPALGLLGFAAETGRIDLLTPTLPDEGDLQAVPGVMRGEQAVPGVTRAAFSEGVSVLNVWASWCPQCREEHATLLALAARPGIRLFGLAVDDTAANVAEYLKSHGNPYHRLSIDFHKSYTRGLKQRGVPSTFVFRADGRFVAKIGRELSPQLVESKLLPAIEKAGQPA
jgi:cytochrome c biogenesis protein CcmG, thiol:disulfide interchange protein DsbE